MPIDNQRELFFMAMDTLFAGMVKSPLIESIIGLDGLFIHVTDRMAQVFGYPSHHFLIGKTAEEIVKESQASVIEQAVLMREKAVQLKQPVSYVFFMAHDQDQAAQPCAWQALISPLFFPDGEIACVRNTVTEYKHVLPVEYGVGGGEGVQGKVTLSKRQHEILFLLCFGYSQDQIAQTLNISRGTVSHIITETLCPKFGMVGSNTRELARCAILAGLHRQVPPGLLTPVVIRL